MAEHVKNINGENFDATVGKGVAVLDFWAPWCGPCKMQGPIFETAAGMFVDKVVFAKVNVDEVPDVAAKFGVRSIPTIVVLKDGATVETKIGLTRASELSEMVKKVMQN